MGQSCSGDGLSKASEELDVQVELLEEKIAKQDAAIRHWIAQTDPMAKQRAMQAMKRKKVLEAQRQQLLGAQFNVESLADQHEQAKVTLKAVDAMRQGRDKLKKDQEKMTTTQVDQLLDDTEELADEMRAINESLAQGSGLADSSLEAEYAALQQEYMPADMQQAQRQGVAQHIPTYGQDMQQAQRQRSGQGVAHAQHIPTYAQAQPDPLLNSARSGSAAGNRRRDQRGYEDAKPAELCMPPPPPPPPQRNHPQEYGRSPVGYDVRGHAAHAPKIDENYANMVAAQALNKAMAPYGVLNMPAPAGRVPVAA